MTAESDDLAKELDAILDPYYDVTEANQTTPSDEEQQVFLEKFERIKTDVIKPVMTEIGKYLETKGHSFQIKDEASLYIDNPSVKMEIYPKTLGDGPIQDHEFPTITFIAEPDIQSVGIEVRDGMPGSPGLTRGHMTNLDSLTSDYVRKQIVAVLKINFVKRGQKLNRSAAT